MAPSPRNEGVRLDNIKPISRTTNFQSPKGTERVYNNNFQLYLAPKIVQKFENFKPKERPLDNLEQINIDLKNDEEL